MIVLCENVQIYLHKNDLPDSLHCISAHSNVFLLGNTVYVTFDRFKTFGADIMFNLTCIFCCNAGINPQHDKPCLLYTSCLIQTGQLAAWIVVIIIAREFIISGFRLIASDNGVVIAASYWGKFKTTFQMLMVIVLILNIQMPFFQILGVILTYVALILTVVSLIDYIVKNKDVLKEQN